MARQTRSQRRARRQAQQASSAGAAPVQRQARPVDNGAAEQRAEPQPQREPERKRGFINFIRESWAELQKVEWPGQTQLIQGVVVVLIACAIVGTFLFVCDQVFKRFVENVLL